MSYLQNITRLRSEDNLAGVVTIQVARKSDILIIPSPIGRTIYGNIVFKDGRNWVSWEVVLETPRLRAKDNSSKEGQSKKTTLDLVIPKDRDWIRRMLELATKDELIVLYGDSNGNKRLLGSLAAPMRFEFDYDTGATFSNFNGYSGQFYYTGPDNDYFYRGDIPAPTGPAPALVKVNGTVVASLAPGEEVDFSTDFDFDFTIVGT